MSKITKAQFNQIVELGKRLAVMEVSVFSQADIVAHATGTYSIPPER